MATRQKSADNGAATAYLRSLKASRLEGVTYEQLAERTGMKLDTVKRLMTNRSDFTVDSFLSLADALGVEAGEALTALSDIVRKQSV